MKRLVVVFGLSTALGCSPRASESTGIDTWAGDFELASAVDLIQLSRLRRIDGTLFIHHHAGQSSLQLSSLVEIRGDLVVESLPSSGSGLRVELPGLLQLGGGIRLSAAGDPITLSAPRLGRADFVELREGQFGLELDQLIELRGRLRVEDVDLESLRLPALRALQGDLRLRRARPVGGEMVDEMWVEAELPISLPSLVDLDGSLELRQTGTFALVAPALDALGGSLIVEAGTVRLEFEKLRVLDGSLRIEDAVFDLQTPGLVRVRGALEVVSSTFTGAPTLDRLRTLDLGQLEHIEGNLRVRDVKGLESVALSSLAAIDGSLQLSGLPALAEVDLSKLSSLPSDLRLERLAMPEVRLDALGNVEGSLVVEDLTRLELVAPLLTTIGQSLEVERSELSELRLPALSDIGRSLFLRQSTLPALTTLEHLTRIGVDLELSDGSGTRTFDLPLLERIGGGLNDQLGDLEVLRNTHLSSLVFPRLTRVLGAIEIRDNPALDPVALSSSLAGVEATTTRTCGNGGEADCRRVPPNG